jgi:hypothetical protein
MMPFSSARDRESDLMPARLQKRMNQAEKIGRHLAEVQGRGEAAGGQVAVETLPAGIRVSPRVEQILAAGNT